MPDSSPFGTFNLPLNSSSQNKPMSSFSFSELVSGSLTELPKFRSLQPPSLPIAPQSDVSPSSWFAIPPGLSPGELLDSPVFLSAMNALTSPTTGNLPVSKPVDWYKNSSELAKVQKNDTENGNFSFGFPTQAKYQTPCGQEQREINGGFNSSSKKMEGDGYNWRKYGQKQVKGSENPRSYYKCTYSNCPTKKKVERSIHGEITEIIYRGTHNHPKPQSTRRSSASFISIPSRFPEIPDHPYAAKMDSSSSGVTTENPSSSMDDDFEESRDEFDDNQEPSAKRWKRERESEGISASGNAVVREPRVVVQTTSEIDILDDGYKWRKYGQKVVRGNPNPRSYYKCTTLRCPVRKHIQRSSTDPRAVITTYEGKHNHDLPVGRGGMRNSSTGQPMHHAQIHNFSDLVHHSNSTGQAPHTLELRPGSGYHHGMTKTEPRDEDDFINSFLR